MATAPTYATPAAAASSRVVLGGLGRGCAALFFRLGLEQGLPVRDRDLVVVGMNFGKGQEAVSITTVIDKRRL